MSGTLPNPAPLMRLILAYRSSTVLFAAMDLDVFSGIAEGDTTAAQLATRCQVKPEPLRLLLEACVAEGLLVAEGGAYRNTPVSDAFLVRNRPTYAVNNLKYAEDLYPAWGQLAELIRTSEPPMAPSTILGDDKEKTRAFVLAMHERARGIGSVLPHLADFTGRSRLLDVGGGPATYSMEIVQRTPGLTSTVLDLPGVLEVTRELVREAGYEDRIELLPGDYLTSPFGTGFDAVLLSGMMHRERPDTCLSLLTRSLDAMNPGGMVVVSDVFFDDDRKSTPPFAVYFALNMMLTSREGSAHAKTEMARWVEEAGFQQVQIRDLPPPNPHSLVIGLKP